MPTIDDSCFEIVRKNGTAWWFDPQAGKDGNIVKEVLGTRSGVQQSNKCFTCNGSSYIEVPNTHFFNNLDAGSFTIGMFVNMPASANNGLRHALFSKAGDFTLYEENGSFYLELDGAIVIDTEPSGVNWADGDTHLLIAWRDATKQVITVGIELYTEYRREEVIDPNPYLPGESDLIIAAEEDGLSSVMHPASTGVQLFSVFFLTGNILQIAERQAYWRYGVVPVNDVATYQLDESAGAIVFDSSGLMNHGVIKDYTSEVWGTLNQGYSWQNNYGYSTGQHAIDNGILNVVIAGVPYLIDSEALIPYQNGKLSLDVLNLPLEMSGRVKLDISIEDILCYKGNGQTYGVVSNTPRVTFKPGLEEFAVFTLFENVEAESGILIRVGTAGAPLYEIGFNAGTLDILISMGSTTHVVEMEEGFNRAIFNFTGAGLDVIADGELLGTYILDSSGSAGQAYVLGSDVGGAIQLANIVLLGVKPGVMNSDEQDNFFSTNLVLPSAINTLYVPCSKTYMLFDVSSASNHAELQSYVADVWDGMQSEYAYLYMGLTKIYPSRNDLNVSAVIPYTIYGEVQSFNIYGVDQFNVAHDWTGGLNMFDCYVNMNPYNVDLGFLTRFWSKDSSDIWVFLNGLYTRSNPFLWHVSELTQDSLEMSLSEGFWNYAFSGSRTREPEGIVIEIVDLMLLNLGNNIQEKYLPV